MRGRIANDVRRERAGVSRIDESKRHVLRKWQNHFALTFDERRLPQRVLHKQSRAKDDPAESALLHRFLDAMVTATHYGFRVWADDRSPTGNLDEEFNSRRSGSVENI